MSNISIRDKVITKNSLQSFKHLTILPLITRISTFYHQKNIRLIILL